MLGARERLRDRGCVFGQREKGRQESKVDLFSLSQILKKYAPI